jgi:hypothetical protein
MTRPEPFQDFYIFEFVENQDKKQFIFITRAHPVENKYSKINVFESDVHGHEAGTEVYRQLMDTIAARGYTQTQEIAQILQKYPGVAESLEHSESYIEDKRPLHNPKTCANVTLEYRKLKI